MSPQFHETIWGSEFYREQLPALVDELTTIGRELKRANDLKEQELVLRYKKQEQAQE